MVCMIPYGNPKGEVKGQVCVCVLDRNSPLLVTTEDGALVLLPVKISYPTSCCKCRIRAITYKQVELTEEATIPLW